MKKLIGHSAILLCTALLVPSLALAGDGSLGATSTGTSTIDLVIPDLVRITGVANLDLGSWTGAGNLTANDDVCVFRNGTATYKITGSGSGAASAFTITDGSHPLAYTVAFNDQSGTVGEIALLTTVLSVQQSGADTSSQTCSAHSADNANFHITITAAALGAVPAGTYTGTLTLVVEPG
jgi:hypothetical protein